MSASPQPLAIAPPSAPALAGTLLLDHYIDHYLQVEYLDTYPDPPDLFYSLRVTRIRKVAVPERSRGPDGERGARRALPVRPRRRRTPAA